MMREKDRMFGRCLTLIVLLAVALLPVGVVYAQTSGVLTVDVIAAPQVIGMGDQVHVQLALSANSSACPITVRHAPLDVMLVLDRSDSMSGDKWTATQQAAQRFVDQMDMVNDRVGVVLFSSSAQLAQGLNDDADAAKSAIAGGRVSGGTHIPGGIRTAADELTGAARAAASQVIVLLSDGQDDDWAIRVAASYKDEGIRFITIGLGFDADEDLLRQIASDPDDYYFAPDPGQLGAIYQSIAESIQQGIGATDLTIVHTFDAANFELVDGSVSPAGETSDDTIAWHLSTLSDDAPQTFSYRVQPFEPGTFDVGQSTQIAFLECEGNNRQLTLDPGPEIRVLPPPPPPEITPSQISGETCEDKCVEEIVRVSLSEAELPPAPQVDIAFVMDVSGSMGDELDVVKRQSTAIMQGLRELVADSAFAAASFVDYPDFRDPGRIALWTYGDSGDYPWRLDRDLTLDIDQVSRALNGIDLLSGADDPEAYSRALYETQFLSWRPGARRIVILFGDSFPHDRDFFGINYGGDPGRDATADTPDDLEATEVVAQLARANISVIAVVSRNDSRTVRFFRYAAEQTGGQYFQLRSANEIPEAIHTLVGAQVAAIGRLGISTASPHDEWLGVSPAAHTNVVYGQAVDFRVRICPGQGTAERGDYSFDLTVTADDEELGTIPVYVTYRPICLPPVDLFVADHPADDGMDCSNLTGEPFWASPDVVVRHADDGEREMQPPRPGEPNFVYVRVRNRGYSDVTDANVHVFWGRAELGAPGTATWHDLGGVNLAVPGEGETWTPSFPWTPPDEGPFNFLVRVEADDDPVTFPADVACENNLAVLSQMQVPLTILCLQSGTLGGQTTLVVVGNEPAELVVELSGLPENTELALMLRRGALPGWSGAVDGGVVAGNRIVAGTSESMVLRDLPLADGMPVKLMLELVSPTDEPFRVPIYLRQAGSDVAGLTVIGFPVIQPAPPPGPVMTPVPLVTPDSPPVSYTLPSLFLTLLLAGFLAWLLFRRQ